MPPPRAFGAYNENFQGSDYTAAEWEFVAAVAAYQKRWGRRFPSWREAFNILVALGYRKVAPPAPLPRMTDAELEVVAQACRKLETENSKFEEPPPATPPGP